MTLLAYHSSPEIRAKYLARVKAHEAADEIVQGTAWEGGKGCLIGCSLHSYSHKQYEVELGVPEPIARLLDAIFEGLPNAEAKGFPARVLESIRPGADLSRVQARFMHWLLTCDEIGLPRIADDRGKAAIARVAELWGRVAEGGEATEGEWAATWAAAGAAAGAAARAAARAATWAAARAAAGAAAWDAARAATWAAARAAAGAAAGAAARAAAGAAAWEAMAAKILSLFAEAPVPAAG